MAEKIYRGMGVQINGFKGISVMKFEAKDGVVRVVGANAQENGNKLSEYKRNLEVKENLEKSEAHSSDF